MSELIRLKNLTVTYERHPAVHHISGGFAEGSLTAIAGPNGAGKSTLLKAIVGELPLAEGSIDRGALARSDFGYLPQAADINRRFPISVADTVMLGAWKNAGAFGQFSRKDGERAREALDIVGLSGFERRHIGALSAGQFQRVLFARLLLQDARVILLDEPFTAIDQRTTADLLKLVLRWNREGRTVIAVLHDFEQVRAHFPETLLIARELVGWGKTQDVMSPANLIKARAMAERWDDDAGDCLPEDEPAPHDLTKREPAE
ncbi:ABC transporter ATP-binding protein [Rhizobium sp. 60-20]|uniref:metal ABC transporter ATP-binding protein n=1 Tax=Rhizobium sp. 60-20 TaxID=1895819 RepID=UPI00092734C0|nr:ABC transporter ATP-binding protein [Rhizobium sp. 60-20]MBN8950450.1 ABC transporter ATP-binding protein [Rhizobium tropici]OJY68972.1 MAG: ABC transporter [Rhizobium sp. 60-20]